MTSSVRPSAWTVLLISSILNFQTAYFHPGNDLPYILYLPTYTATAWYHGKLDDELQVHGAFLSVIDTLLIAKNGYRMLGIQKWKDHSDNADRGERIRGHHWALVGLISYSQHWRRYLCFPVLMQLISGAAETK